MFINRILVFVVAVSLTVTAFVGGVSATFIYARSAADAASSVALSDVSSFDYSSSGLGETEKTVIEVAIDQINDESDVKGFKFVVVYPSIQNRDKYGYVGSMDKWWYYYLNVPEEVSVIMTLPEADPLGKEGIYFYIAKITKAELNAKTVGEILPDVFRVRADKNADGVYEQTECKKGSSPVTLYEYDYYKQQANKINGFAIFEGETVWQES